jgi:hypothetical protein
MDPFAMSPSPCAWSGGGYVGRWRRLANSIPVRTPMAVAAPTAPYGDRLAMSLATRCAKHAAAPAFAENLSTVYMFNMGVLPLMPGLDARNRVHLHHVGALRRTRSAADAGLIGRGVARVVKIEIIFQVSMGADEQKQAAAGG